MGRKRHLTIGRSWYAFDVPFLLGGFLVLAGWLARLAWRWRRGLVPVWVFILAGFTSLVIHAWWPTWWALPGALAVLVIASLVATLVNERLATALVWLVTKLVPGDADAGERGVLDRPVERVYAFGLLVVAGAWMSATSLWGWNQATWWTGLASLAVFGGPWSWHRRIRSKGPANRFTRAWPKRVADDEHGMRGLVGSKVVRSERLQNSGVLLTISLKPAETIYEAAGAARRLVSLFNLRTGAVQITEDPTNGRRVKVRILPKDPWKAKLPHPVLGLETSQSLAHLGCRLDLGLLDDGTPNLVDLRHLLIVGQTGGGKSVLVESILLWLFQAGDVAVVGSDMAAGATLGPWESLLAAPLATDEDESITLLERLLEIVSYRERKLAAEKAEGGPDSFAPSPEMPWLVAIFDEFPDLVEAGGERVKKLTGRLAKRARKVGVRLILATQNPTKSDVGSTEMRAQFTKISLALDEQQSKTMWGGSRDLGWRSEGLGTGVFIVKDAEHQVPRQTKGYFASVAERNAFIARTEPHPLDEGTKALLLAEVAEVAEEPQVTPKVGFSHDGETPRWQNPTPAVPHQRTQDRRGQVLALLGDEPVSPAQIRAQLDIAESTLRRVLAELEKDGLVKREGRGKWTRHHVHSV
ncbi:winged helix-turn-helix domain-containing protein [Amycolatopsis sp. 195334CR]|uniref:winged helix-turn-helix domain-containing protein n=1 Tax=Amycolatopsis sp. 195334CR TaxID=2814588 RepID=UPI001A8E5438|nr:FtsK/SpoIIIE domain-containing protein [Amycolatopsis sp. 195334CR]MBN6037494.1 helix-turn-helix domain-containing protein [Amycolatopsis sp. 195334CR]